ncbi:MAG: hypothetical protein K5707_03865 [Clostridia bacterium]|nr:hypothetical protein [Clostridia bacterium]
MTALPAAFMTAVCVTYILMAQEGFRLPQSVSYAVGAAATILLLVTYLVALLRKQPSSCIIK